MESTTVQSADLQKASQDEAMAPISQEPDLAPGDDIAMEVKGEVKDQSDSPMIEEETKMEQQDTTEEEKEVLREKKKWDGYVPPEKRRPLDEFFDLKTL